MHETIGEAAGRIWQHLSENGPASVTKVTTATGLGKNDVQRAIGWLAREEKIDIEVIGRVETISLR